MKGFRVASGDFVDRAYPIPNHGSTNSHEITRTETMRCLQVMSEGLEYASATKGVTRDAIKIFFEQPAVWTISAHDSTATRGYLAGSGLVCVARGPTRT